MNLLVTTWRDTSHPDSGGSERYVEKIAVGLAARGHDVTVLCPRHPNSMVDETVDGVRYLRRGGRFTVYLWALVAVLRLRPDLVVDVQNGMPFLTRLVARCPVVVLVHHLHKLQWRSWFGPVLGRVGWWLESWVAPRVYRGCRYVTVSEHTKAELAGLGIAPDRVTVVPNGLDPVPRVHGERDPRPLLVAVSRLVPHKRIEHAVEAVARLSARWPDLRLEIIGRGPSADPIAAYAEELGVGDRVTLHGFVDERTKHEILARSWVHLCPSVKEGWGIVVMEAGAHGVPTVAYHAAGGVGESILDGETGMLADDLDGFVAATEHLLRCGLSRVVLGEGARKYVAGFEWEHSVRGFDRVVRGILHGREIGAPRRAPATVKG
ncbi:glycosyltransferase family 4 protein [Virgisporangium ochraceum]|uniref:Glycosyl hydrolase n=1 Tax=Virgisporangium ochraceum TaxID=65505 RepID=A0A8J3ZUC2_9ACTN|nr:glycosyltransferase family 4 protein [Virgisporangium ochraceum]GIJ68595.1 glycosyl hydrolase [Virgisporangium ochraceum]